MPMMGLGKDAYCRLNYICEIDDIPNRPFRYKVQTGDGKWVLDESEPYGKSIGLLDLAILALQLLRSISLGDLTRSRCTLLTCPEWDQDGNVNNIGFPEPAIDEQSSDHSTEQNLALISSDGCGNIDGKDAATLGDENTRTG